MSFAPTTAGVAGALLAQGPRADVRAWLDTDAVEPPDLVVKRYRGQANRRAALSLAAALSAVDHPHLVPLVGVVALGPTVIGIVLPRLTTRSAGEWLAERRVVSAGEAVTLLAPILLALLHVERRRLDPRLVLEADIGLEDILFDRRGAPVVTGVRVASSVSARIAPSAIARRLVSEVIATTVGGSTAARATLLALCADDADIDELLEVVFELDEPAPLEEVPPVAVDSTGAGETEPESIPREGESSSESRSLRWPLPPPSAPAAPRRSPAASLRPSSSGDVGRALVANLRRVRPRTWATSGILVVSSVIGIGLLGGPAVSGSGSPTTPVAAGAASTPAETRATDEPTSTVPSQPSVVPGASDPRSETGADMIDDQATNDLLRGSDADGATRELLKLRAGCLAALDRDCLAAVDQAGSSALENDTAAVADPTRLEQRLVELRISAVVNRLGGAVLYRALTPDGKPASVLVTRTEAGWRLRSIT